MFHPQSSCSFHVLPRLILQNKAVKRKEREKLKKENVLGMGTRLQKVTIH